ncbi:rod shape-determining protein RodA [Ferruginibacter sp. HRS2-29]|uniref:rod shape-determining protein RodA n=1 Tax=Ferruginibacter sp. HRS2-29 TaxID=2487334 RepID=UPI0020CC70E5|nr:rod shape-determining protein RodA [Ferruginibacter sp. HRS2-29]MCP9750516.1 rod shape-determining protein RodA [Ferruginibacter sp. HRS2-29]
MYQKNPSISKGVDWLMVWLYALIVIIGLVCIFSVEYKSGESVVQTLLGFKKNYSKQLFYFGACIVIATFILLTDSKLFTAMANLSYLVGIVLILATFIPGIGKEIKGSRSWIPLGFMNLQPVELCKIFTSLALAKYLSMQETDFQKPRSQLIAAAIAFTPAVFSILQGETGLALVYFSFLIAMYREGLPPGYLIAGVAMAVLLVVSLLFHTKTLLIAFAALAAIFLFFNRRQIRRNKQLLFIVLGAWLVCSLFVGVAVPFVFNKVFKKYQADRIFSMVGVENPFTDNKTGSLSPEEEKLKQKKSEQQDYNVKQSKIAIGSGGLAGKGFLKGTQTQGDFVPEQHTDFIFTSVGENFGFWGCAGLLMLYLIMLLRIVKIAERQRSTFSRVYAYSVAGIIFFHVAVNICVTIGLAPVIGITLPLMSYGGSSLITFTILLFILIKLDADRQMVLR